MIGGIGSPGTMQAMAAASETAGEPWPLEQIKNLSRRDSPRTHIRYTRCEHNFNRIVSAVALSIGAIILCFFDENPEASAVFGWFMIMAGVVWILLNESFAWGICPLGEPNGSGWVRQFFDEANAALRERNLAELRRCLKDIDRFRKCYDLDLPKNLRLQFDSLKNYYELGTGRQYWI